MVDLLISVVIPLRNRAGIRLQNCLASLRRQTDIDTSAVELVLSDFGSNPEHAADIKRVAEEFGAVTVRTEDQQIWNRSRALNRGIAATNAPITLCTDADMIFESNFLSVILSSIKAVGGLGMAVCRCRDLPDLGPERRYDETDFSILKSKATIRPTGGTGACQAAATAWFKKVGGYDEKYVHWGFEDTDMFYRAKKDGLVPCWIHDRTSMLHQYHPTMRHDRLVLKWKNKLRYYLTRGQIVKKSALLFS